MRRVVIHHTAGVEQRECRIKEIHDEHIWQTKDSFGFDVVYHCVGSSQA